MIVIFQLWMKKTADIILSDFTLYYCFREEGDKMFVPKVTQ